jgi:hypothetical protein
MQAWRHFRCSGCTCTTRSAPHTRMQTHRRHARPRPQGDCVLDAAFLGTPPVAWSVAHIFVCTPMAMACNNTIESITAASLAQPSSLMWTFTNCVLRWMFLGSNQRSRKACVHPSPMCGDCAALTSACTCAPSHVLVVALLYWAASKSGPRNYSYIGYAARVQCVRPLCNV